MPTKVFPREIEIILLAAWDKKDDGYDPKEQEKNKLTMLRQNKTETDRRPTD